MNQPQEPQQELQKAFLVELSSAMEQIDANLAKLKTGWDKEAARQIQMVSHKISGSSATLGYHQLSFAARSIEVGLKDASAQSEPEEAARIVNLLDGQIQELKKILSADKTVVAINMPHFTDSEQAIQSLQETRSSQVVFLVEDDALQAHELASQVAHFGYTVKIFRQPDQIISALALETPAAILMDIVFPEGEMAGLDAIRSLHDAYPVPVIFISIRDDVLARLNAIRAGGEAYFTKPVNLSLLVDTLDRYTIQADPIPYRILIVDDSIVQANFTALHLVKAGMDVRIVNEPLKSLELLKEFGPDLILLDMYMPECTGMELAAVIRQMEMYISVPIVFLSSETDRDKQLEAVGLGGDDFLTKPIQPPHLVSSVTARVERYRRLRSLMLHDSLTGLFNHTATRESLGHELLKAARQNMPLSYVMIDIDHFKSVNDTYGHSTGDRVLKSLAQLLTKRLRQSDVVGRYGGEEFAVILPNTNGEDAYAIMDSLRVGFATLRHVAGEREFAVTFSCGIATFPEFNSIAGLSEAADQALYKGKNLGRDRVVMAGNNLE